MLSKSAESARIATAPATHVPAPYRIFLTNSLRAVDLALALACSNNKTEVADI